ncbi:MAG: pyridoxamine 5'-phosphate oxidase family protein [Candidatus Adiutrix sp.]|jgi:nitroimidazol reductase NimA-like FMN-containing flavoprotein (pyridoxamine 5'-phosphate oxidase superfamily)|nr:pyridoxamine 5'-phosphate oxidase family protein [Candidatus Adiutrix sp.]
MNEKIMRRRDRQLGPDECRAILERGEYGVLATTDAEGQPYAVPLSFLFVKGYLYFHCACEGHKIDNLAANPKVSFAVVGRTDTVYKGSYTVYYESVVAFGKVMPVTDDNEREAALRALTHKYYPANLDGLDEYLHKRLKSTAVYALDPEVITGKSNRK